MGPAETGFGPSHVRTFSRFTQVGFSKIREFARSDFSHSRRGANPLSLEKVSRRHRFTAYHAKSGPSGCNSHWTDGATPIAHQTKAQRS